MERVLMFIGSGSGGGDPKLGSGNSLIDRLNSKYTPLLLFVLALFVTSQYYIGEPIRCWTPAWFNNSMDDYTNNLCWVKNTYKLPFEQRLYREYHIPGQLGYKEWDGGGAKSSSKNAKMPLREDPRDFVSYYQWVGLILCFQAVFFYFPHGVWVMFSRKSGISVSNITDAAVTCLTKREVEDKDNTIMYMTNHMARFLLGSRRLFLMDSVTKTRLFVRTIFYGNYLMLMYILTKILYIANIVLQFLAINRFLGTNFLVFGYEVIRKLRTGRNIWGFSDKFPRVTHCDFHVRVLGHLQRHSVQCTLTINLFNEAVYILIWFWYVFVFLLSVADLAFWMHRCLFKRQRRSYIRTRLIAQDAFFADAEHPEKNVEAFVNDYLGADGVLILRLVTMNASDIIAAELTCGLYRAFLREKKAKSDKLDRQEIETIRLE